MTGCFDDAELDFDCPACKKSIKVTLGKLTKPGMKCPKCGVTFESSQLKKAIDKVERDLKDVGKRLSNLRL